MNVLTDFSSYPKPEQDGIIKRLQRELKDASVDSLDWQNENGFIVKPFYTENPRPLSSAGTPPYFRGNKSDRNEWLVRQDFEFVPGVGKRILDSLQMGVASIGLRVSENPQTSVKAELEGVLADIIHFHFEFEGAALPFLHSFFEWYAESGFSNEAFHGSATLKKPGEIHQTFLLAYPHFRFAGVDSSIMADRGAGTVTEMGLALSALHENLVALMSAGMTVDEASARIALRMGIGSSFFVETAKFRAIRELYAEIVAAYNPIHACSQNLFLTAVTSRWNKTIPDPHNNLLRTTTEAMSAVIAGIDELCVRPFDELFATESKNGLRWARNIQHLLAEESKLNITADPAGGSYYIENLTEQLAEAAWQKFRHIEENGGYPAFNEKGLTEQWIQSDADQAKRSLAEGKKILIGVNRYMPKTMSEIPVERGRLASEAEQLLTSKNAKL